VPDTTRSGEVCGHGRGLRAGVFNDSFFRQSAMLLAISEGARSKQGWIMALFTVPYLIVAAPAGWLADRFPKRGVVIAAKCWNSSR